MEKMHGCVVISSTIYQDKETGSFLDYRFVVELAASKLGFKVLRNSEDAGSTQLMFENCLKYENPIFIAIIGRKITQNVKNEFEMALRMGLHIITLVKGECEKDGNCVMTPEIQTELKRVSRAICEKECVTFANCEQLYEATRERLTEYVKYKWNQKVAILKQRNQIYPTTADMISHAKKIVVLCQETSLLLLGPRDDSVEKECYHQLINWIQDSENDARFIHIFSKKKTVDEMQKGEYTEIESAKRKLLEIMQSNNGSGRGIEIILRTAENFDSCVIADSDMLYSTQFGEATQKGESTYFIHVPGAFINHQDSDAIIGRMSQTGHFLCSKKSQNIEEMIESIYKEK